MLPNTFRIQKSREMSSYQDIEAGRNGFVHPQVVDPLELPPSPSIWRRFYDYHASSKKANVIIFCLIIVACIISVVGSVDQKYGKNHPYTDEDLAVSNSQTNAFCENNSCVRTNLVALNETCAAFDGIMKQPNPTIDCTSICDWRFCPMNQSVVCKTQCNAVWNHYTVVLDGVGEDGKERLERGTILFWLGMSIDFCVIAYVVLLVMIQCFLNK